MGKYRRRYKNNKYSKGSLEVPIAFAIGSYSFLKYNNYKVGIIVFVVVFTVITIVKTSIHQYKKNKIQKKYIKSGIGLVDKMTGEEFEDFLLAHFIRLGYKGNTTSKTNDYGADLILKKDGQTIVVQAKRWINKVGIEAIQQVIGAREYYKANKCIVICNNYYTQNAINLAESSSVEIWDRKKLLDVMSNANGKEILEEQFKTDKIEHSHLCKKCGADMVLKKGRYGDFYGCSKYPKCRYTEKV